MIEALLTILLFAAIYGILLFLIAPKSIWLVVGIYIISMVILYLGKRNLWGYVGRGDAMGNAMQMGFVDFFWMVGMVLASVAFVACMGWWLYRYIKGV